MGDKRQPPDLLPGTLDLLILNTLTRGPMHGYGIAQQLQQRSDARVTLTPAGRRQLASEHAEFQQIVAAIQRVLNTA